MGHTHLGYFHLVAAVDSCTQVFLWIHAAFSPGNGLSWAEPSRGAATLHPATAHEGPDFHTSLPTLTCWWLSLLFYLAQWE